MHEPRLSPDGRTLTVHVPMTFKTRGGRKLVITPDGVPSWAEPRTRIDNTMVKALARSFRWRKLLETSVYATVEEIAAAEKINTSYISRILRLTLDDSHVQASSEIGNDDAAPYVFVSEFNESSHCTKERGKVLDEDRLSNA